MLPAENGTSSNLETEESIDLLQYVNLFRQWWWLVVLVTVLAGAGAYVASKRMTPVYEASTKLLIVEASSKLTTDSNSIYTSEQLASTYAQIITARPVMESVIKRLNLNISPDALGASITATPITNTQLLTLTVSNTNPLMAADIANATAEIFASQLEQTQSERFSSSKQSLQARIDELNNQMEQTRKDLDAAKNAPQKDTAEIDTLNARLTQYQQISSSLTLSLEQLQLTEVQAISTVKQIETALSPKNASSPKTFQNTLLAAVVGLLLSVGGVIAYDFLNDNIKNPEEITRRFRLPVLGWIGEYEDTGKGLITQAEPRSPVSESFRALRSNVQYASVDRPLHTLLITSASPSDGKTTVTSNLGVVMSQIGRHVMIMDADLHRPRVHRVFNKDLTPGLSLLFVQPSLRSMDGTRQETEQEGLTVVTAGELPPNPSELLGSNKMRDILKIACEESDLVLVDTPPLLAVSDTMSLAPIVDGVLLVIRPGGTKMGAVKASVDQLRDVGANIIGVVLNGMDQKRNRFGYYYKNYYYNRYHYSHYYHYQEGSKKDSRKNTKNR